MNLATMTGMVMASTQRRGSTSPSKSKCLSDKYTYRFQCCVCHLVHMYLKVIVPQVSVILPVCPNACTGEYQTACVHCIYMYMCSSTLKYRALYFLHVHVYTMYVSA